MADAELLLALASGGSAARVDEDHDDDEDDLDDDDAGSATPSSRQQSQRSPSPAPSPLPSTKQQRAPAAATVALAAAPPPVPSTAAPAALARAAAPPAATQVMNLADAEDDDSSSDASSTLGSMRGQGEEEYQFELHSSSSDDEPVETGENEDGGGKTQQNEEVTPKSEGAPGLSGGAGVWTTSGNTPDTELAAQLAHEVQKRVQTTQQDRTAIQLLTGKWTPSTEEALFARMLVSHLEQRGLPVPDALAHSAVASQRIRAEVVIYFGGTAIDQEASWPSLKIPLGSRFSHCLVDVGGTSFGFGSHGLETDTVTITKLAGPGEREIEWRQVASNGGGGSRGKKTSRCAGPAMCVLQFDISAAAANQEGAVKELAEEAADRTAQANKEGQGACLHFGLLFVGNLLYPHRVTMYDPFPGDSPNTVWTAPSSAPAVFVTLLPGHRNTESPRAIAECFRHVLPGEYQQLHAGTMVGCKGSSDEDKSGLHRLVTFLGLTPAVKPVTGEMLMVINVPQVGVLRLNLGRNANALVLVVEEETTKTLYGVEPRQVVSIGRHNLLPLGRSAKPQAWAKAPQIVRVARLLAETAHARQEEKKAQHDQQTKEDAAVPTTPTNPATTSGTKRSRSRGGRGGRGSGGSGSGSRGLGGRGSGGRGSGPGGSSGSGDESGYSQNPEAVRKRTKRLEAKLEQQKEEMSELKFQARVSAAELSKAERNISTNVSGGDGASTLSLDLFTNTLGSTLESVGKFLTTAQQPLLNSMTSVVGVMGKVAGASKKEKTDAEVADKPVGVEAVVAWFSEHQLGSTKTPQRIRDSKVTMDMLEHDIPDMADEQLQESFSLTVFEVKKLKRLVAAFK